MTDIADLAAAREQELREDAIAAHHRRLASASRATADWPGLADAAPAANQADPAPCAVCAVCAEPIPAARLQAVPGCRTCIDCQRELERAVHPQQPTRKGPTP